MHRSNSSMEYKKIVLIGVGSDISGCKTLVDIPILVPQDTNVGKSCLFTRFNDGHFPETQATILDNFTTMIPRTTGPPVRCVVWDTAGQERFRSLVGNYFNGAKAVIVVYDITSKESYDSLTQSQTTCWLQLVKERCPKNVILAIVGNKCDLEDSRQVELETGKEIAESNGALFFETSAKTGENVRKLFMGIADRLPDENEGRKNFEESFVLNPSPPHIAAPNRCPCK